MRNDKTNYTQMGMAALVPGMQHMIDLMQEQLDGIRAQLAALQLTGDASPSTKREQQPVVLHAVKLHPRDKNHPEHDAWRAMISAIQRKRYASLTPKQQAAENERLKTARKRKLSPAQLRTTRLNVAKARAAKQAKAAEQRAAS